ncbi:molybdopterin-binding protein, partial [Veillonella sp.]|uniref:molybdopterin-binding protein n=1 Tax=Veillonella sp. TaxID=1926307 RepID=UPI001B4975CD
MIVELVSTGSELLLGDTVNTNVSWLAQELNKLGYTIAYQSTIGDNRGRMAEIFRRAAERADIVISTGGLGPTQGDITREVLASAMGREVEFNSLAMTEVQKFFKRVNREVPTAASRREAMLPVGAGVLRNPVGVAPGVTLEVEDTTFILLPGPPGEMKGMFTDSVVPYLQERFGSQGVVKSYRYGIYGIREIDLEDRLMDLVKEQSNPTIAFLIKKGYIELRITAKANTAEEAEALLRPWDEIIRNRLGTHVGRSLDIPMEDLRGKNLTVANATISTAESCTSG